MITFNISTSNRKFIQTSDEPYQILPSRTTRITQKVINSYLEPTNDKNNILIHTSYITRIWKPDFLLPSSKEEEIVNDFINLAQRIKTKYILIHGPGNVQELNNFCHQISKLKQMFVDAKLTCCIEMPAFAKEVFTTYEVNYKFIQKYFAYFANNGFEIVIDTAHLYANGLDSDDIIKLLDYFKNAYHWIHLNGNCREKYTSDKHVTITSKDNKMTNVDKLLDFIGQNCSDKYCICEIVFNNYNYWSKLVSSHKGLTLCSKSLFLNL